MKNIADVRTVADLIAHIEAGGAPGMTMFWGHRPSKDGTVTKSCFSQWFDARFHADGVDYASAEQYMMAEKARLFGDDATRGRILGTSDPAAMKALGREIRHFDEQTWLAHRWDIVVRANAAKFSQNPALRAFLVLTGDHVLVEASPVDRIWGIGLAADNPRAQDPREWDGANLLGFALMEVRSRLATIAA